MVDKRKEQYYNVIEKTSVRRKFFRTAQVSAEADSCSAVKGTDIIMKNNSKNRRGFTLLEVIVVLVILAILAVVLIPALTGYIDKANEKSAVAEARSVVMACQTVASEAYAEKVKFGGDDAIAFKNSDYEKEALALAEIDGSGEISSVNFSDKNKVTDLEYKSSSGITIRYTGKAYEVLA